jgi:hypothetical protein
MVTTDVQVNISMPLAVAVALEKLLRHRGDLDSEAVRLPLSAQLTAAIALLEVT